MKKLFKSFLMVFLSVFTVFALVACGNGKKILETYLLEQDGKQVEKDFALDSKITFQDKEYDLEWKSDNDCIKLEKGEKNYVAKVSFPDSGEVAVKLTVKVDGASKDFTVRVKALDVYSFSKAYAFPKDKQSVIADFDLDREFTLSGKKATISWSVDDEYKPYINISENGNKCLVSQNSLNPQVFIKATFTYNNVSTTKQYRMVVSQESTHDELVSQWYSVAGTPNDFQGWIVQIATVYSEQYGNVSFYVLDEQGDAGYYGYRVNVAAADASKIKVGAYVHVVGQTNTFYKGLVETNAKSEATFDESKNKTEAEMAAMVKAIDTEVIAGLPAANQQESRLVSLTGWTVDSINKKNDKFEDNFLTLVNGGVKVKVGISKYFEGAYNTDAQKDAIKASASALAKGDVVNVKGLLSFNEEEGGFIILPLSAADVVKSTEAAATYPAATAIKGLKEAVEKVLPTTLVPGQKVITLPVDNSGASVELSLQGRPSTTVALDNDAHTITLNPGVEEMVSILATYKHGEFTSKVIYKIHLKAMTAEQLAQATLDELLPLADIAAFGKLSDMFGKDITKKYGTTLKFELVSDPTDYIKVENGEVVAQPLHEEDVTLKVIATFGEGDSAVSKEATVTTKLVKMDKMSIKDFLKQEKGFTGILEGTIVAVNKDSGKTALVLKDETGAIFSYAGAEVTLGQKVKIVATKDENNNTPQIKDIVIIETIDAEGTLAKAEAAAGTPTTLDLQKVHDQLVGTATVTKLDSHEKLVKEFSGKYLLVEGYVIKKGNYYQLMLKSSYTEAELSGNEGKGYVSIYAAPSLNAADLVGKKVQLYGFFRGDSVGSYITLQVTKFVEVTDGNDDGGNTGGNTGGSTGGNTGGTTASTSKTIDLTPISGAEDKLGNRSLSADVVATLAGIVNNENLVAVKNANDGVYAMVVDETHNFTGLKLGSGSKTGEITFELKEATTSVTLHVYAWSATGLGKVTINGQEFQLAAGDEAGRDITVTFTAATKEITVSTAAYNKNAGITDRRVVITSIALPSAQ